MKAAVAENKSDSNVSIPCEKQSGASSTRRAVAVPTWRSYLDNKSFPLRFALYGLDCHIFAFPFGFAHNSKRSSAHHLNKKTHLVFWENVESWESGQPRVTWALMVRESGAASGVCECNIQDLLCIIPVELSTKLLKTLINKDDEYSCDSGNQCVCDVTPSLAQQQLNQSIQI